MQRLVYKFIRFDSVFYCLVFNLGYNHDKVNRNQIIFVDVENSNGTTQKAADSICYRSLFCLIYIVNF